MCIRDSYKQGWIVSSGGSYYRCIQAHTNHTPPNATYWVDVTTDGLSIIGVPDASSANRGVVTIGTQSFNGYKTFLNDLAVIGSVCTDVSTPVPIQPTIGSAQG